MKPNAFTIPEKSAVIDGDRRTFRSKPKHFPRNLPPITLKGSSKFPEPKMMEKKQ